MKKLPVGLVVEGNCTSSTILRLPGIIAELGPIKASSLQVARRVSNFLKGGYATPSYLDLHSARIVLIRVPDGKVARVASELSNADADWREHTFVLCETWAPTEMLEPLRVLGATIASVVALGSSLNKTFAVEGDITAVRLLRRLLERANASTIELRPGRKHLLFAAGILGSAIPVPVLMMAAEALRDSGVGGKQLAHALEEMNREAAAGVIKGGRMTWGGPLAESLESTQRVYWEQLCETKPEMCRMLREVLNWSQRYMGEKASRAQGA